MLKLNLNHTKNDANEETEFEPLEDEDKTELDNGQNEGEKQGNEEGDSIEQPVVDDGEKDTGNEEDQEYKTK